MRSRMEVASQRRQAPPSANTSLIAPTGGWVSAQNLAASPPNTAAVLENWYPTSTGIKMRSGALRHATVSESGEPCESLMAYIGLSVRKMFAGCDGNIFDLTSVADPDVEPTPVVTGQQSNYYSHVNLANAGGNFMPVANGTDPMLVYDGTDFLPVFDTDLEALDYDAESAAFTVGETLTGGTSGDTAVIVKVIDNGSTGTLWLRDATGPFQNDETITDGAGGSATADGVSTTLIPALTGVDTSTIDHVNTYRSRLWLTNRTMTAYALAVDAISGAVSQTVELAGVFRRGGYILFTATWSLDAGDGLDDKIVFATTEGEIAVYQGDPADTDTWGLVGLYDCSPPMGKNAFEKVAGDLLIETEIGLIPISQITTKDPAAMALAAVSRNIQPDWLQEARQRRSMPWEIVKWTSRNIAYVTCPATAPDNVTPPICFAVNLETGAWCKLTGWNTRCMILHDDRVYFGTNDGRVLQADITGSDDGEIIYYSYVGQPDHLGAPGVYKTVSQARAIFRTLGEFNPTVSVTTDYTITLPTFPSAGSPIAPSLWDVGLWDQAQWDAGVEYYTVQTRFVSVGRSGFVHAPVILVTSGSEAAPSAELVTIDMVYQSAALVI